MLVSSKSSKYTEYTHRYIKTLRTVKDKACEVIPSSVSKPWLWSQATINYNLRNY